MKTNILLLALVLVTIGGCKKNNSSARQITYNIIPQNSSGVAGTVSFTDVVDSSQTKVDIEVSNTPGFTYVAHIHYGPPSNYRGAVYVFDPIFAANKRISYQQNIPLLYDSALVYNGTFVLHDSTGNNVLGLCGIGVNKDSLP